MKIIIINPKTDFNQNQISILESQGDVIWIENGKYQKNSIFNDPDEKLIVLGPEVVDWQFPNEFINKITNLKAICISTTGFSWIDGKYLREKGINLLNVPKYSTESVAEYAIYMMLNVAKKLPLIIKNNWKLDYDKHQGWEVKGKTMGIIGLGYIGKRIAEIGQQIGMNVIYWSKNSKDNRFKYQEFDELLKNSDFIFPTLAKNNETKNIINPEKINLIKNGSFLISITGTDLFDFEYALSKIKDNSLAGLALESEEKKLIDFEGNILITPPIAWFTKEAFEEDIRIWVENIISVTKNQPQNVTN
jgi:phosphoglycerate dehydrogenase-like enzyme